MPGTRDVVKKQDSLYIEQAYIPIPSLEVRW